jgi:hypothetical protein
MIGGSIISVMPQAENWAQVFCERRSEGSRRFREAAMTVQ